MADVHSEAVRSYNMSKIRSKDTKPEMLVRKFLFANKLRYTLHNKKLPGKPDMVFSKTNTVIFVHGCFWHGHDGCKYFILPKTRTEWWANKIIANRKKDTENTIALEELGWRVIVIWECELKPTKRNITLTTLLKRLINENV